MAQYRAGVNVGALTSLLSNLTGNSPQDRTARFVEEELPKIVEEAVRDTDPRNAPIHAQKLIGAAQKAGYGPKNVELLLDRLIKPILANVSAGEMEKFAREFQPSTAITETPTPAPAGLTGLLQKYGGGADLSLPFSVENKPGRQFDQADALKLAAMEGRGAKVPASLAGLLQTPSAVGQNEAQAASANALADYRREQQRLESQKRTERAMMEGDEGQVARADSPSLTNFMLGERTRAQRQPLIESQVGKERSLAGLNQARIGTESARQGELGTRLQANVALRDRRNAGVSDEGTESVTETERTVKPEDQLIAERTIARTAADRGATTPEDIKAIAADLGFELEGEPQIATGLMGFGTAKLTGNFRLRPRATRRTTTKGKAGSPTSAKPEKAGEVQGRRRLKFDKEGNLVP